MLTIRSLARIAGVSIGTVSRALRNDPRISAATRARIQALATEYQYAPNTYARQALAGARTCIGVIVPEVYETYSGAILSGIMQAALPASYYTITFESKNDLARTCLAIDILIEQRVAGILLCAACQNLIPAASILRARSYDIPIVAIDATRSVVPLDRICTDEAQMATDAVAYLQQLGHQRIAYLGFSQQDDRNERMLHVIDALKARGVYQERWIFTCVTDFHIFIDAWRAMAASMRPTALIGWNDSLLIQFMQYAQQAGMRFPDDLSLLGYGNFLYASFWLPALTSFEQFPAEVGKRGFELLLTRIREKASAYVPRIEYVPAQLMTRESTAPVRLAVKHV
jgi:LacI family transcriptional regulator